VLRVLALCVTACVAFAGVGGATALSRFTWNIDDVDADTLLGDDRPEASTPDPEDPNAGTPLNIVLMGSDDRSGANAGLVADDTEGMRSDTTMILHISADRSRVELVSVPRDSAPPPGPTTTNPMSGTKFNSAFAAGADLGGDVASGALCTMRTIESLTDVRMDGFVVIDFAGFQAMIDALGGVELCIPEAVHSPKANNLTLPAGVQMLDGGTALSYARARTGQGLGDGSDLGRIGRQQELMAALVRTVLGKNLLTDAGALVQFLDAVTSSLTMSDNFSSVTGLAGLAYSAKGIDLGSITFMTVPNGTDPTNPNNVVWTSDADQLWDNLKNDRPAGATEQAGGEQDAGSSDATPETGTGPAGPEDATETAPAPAETKDAGEEAFSAQDVTSVCG
jgi:LCP family protein required for cell wall assembly